MKTSFKFQGNVEIDYLNVKATNSYTWQQVIILPKQRFPIFLERHKVEIPAMCFSISAKIAITDVFNFFDPIVSKAFLMYPIRGLLDLVVFPLWGLTNFLQGNLTIYHFFKHSLLELYIQNSAQVQIKSISIHTIKKNVSVTMRNR